MLLKSSSNNFFLVCLKISFLLILWSFYFGGILDFRYFELVPLVFIAITFLIFGFLYFYSKNEFFDRDSVVLLSLVFVHVFLVSFFGLLFNPGYFYIPSIIYEIYKLYLCLFFVVFLCVENKSGWVDFFYRTISIFMLANFVVLLLQHTFGVNIINMMGVKYDVSFYQSRGRPTGLTLNANVIGSLSLMFYIFLHYVNTHKDLLYIKGIKYIKLMSLITALCVVLSSSKASFFCLIFFVSISKLRIKNFLFYFVILLVSLFLVYYLDLYSVRSKLENYASYIYYLSQDISTLDLRFIEGRIYFWIHALNIFQNNFLGLGLGTWGDFSSSFNPYVRSITAYNDSSDSALSHYLVEQGLFAILYLFIIYFSLKKSGSKVNSFFIVLCILFLTNSGFSQPMFYLGFWINAILFYTIRKRVVINV